jgi:hypothetical protein
VDGAAQGTVGGLTNGTNFTISAGTHNIDIVYTAQDMSLAYYLGSQGGPNKWGGNFVAFGWIPYANGQMSSAITSIVPG